MSQRIHVRPYLDHCPYRFWKVLELDIATFQDLEMFGKREIFQNVYGEVLDFVGKSSKLEYLANSTPLPLFVVEKPPLSVYLLSIVHNLTVRYYAQVGLLVSTFTINEANKYI